MAVNKRTFLAFERVTSKTPSLPANLDGRTVTFFVGNGLQAVFRPEDSDVNIRPEADARRKIPTGCFRLGADIHLEPISGSFRRQS